MIDADTQTSDLCSLDRRVRVHLEGAGADTYVVADFDHRHSDLVEILEILDERGWEAVPEEEEEAEVLDTGVRIRFRRKPKRPRNHKLIEGLFSTPVLMGLGAIAMNADYIFGLLRPVVV